MIEARLELKLDSFVVNSMGKSEDASSQMSARALKLSCEKIASVRRLTEDKPSADFAFLGTVNKQEAHGETDQAFDEKIFQYLSTYSTVDASRINIASGSAGYIAVPKAISSGEMGRLYVTESSNQRGLGLEMVLMPEEFDAAWELMTQQKVRKLIATLTCFKLLPGALTEEANKIFVAGVLSCSLQFAPND